MNQIIIGSFSKDDGDGNQNGKKAIKQQLCSCITLFFCRHCTTTTWKCLISRFVEDVNTRERLSCSFPELPYRFKSRKICEIKFEVGRVHFLVTFSQASPSWLLKLPILVTKQLSMTATDSLSSFRRWTEETLRSIWWKMAIRFWGSLQLQLIRKVNRLFSLHTCIIFTITEIQAFLKYKLSIEPSSVRESLSL